MTEKEVQELKRMEYTKYLKTDYRSGIRTKVKEKYWNKCNRCWLQEDLHVHHHKYTHRWEWRKEIRDVELICKVCHYKEHKCKKDHVCSIMGDYVNINTGIFENEDIDILAKLYPLLNNCIDWEYNEVLQPQLKKLYKNNTKWLVDLIDKMTEEIIFMEIEWNIYVNPLIVHKWWKFNKWWWEEWLTNAFIKNIGGTV